MALTTEQQATLKAAINLVPEWIAQPMNSDGDYFIAAELNKASSPAFIVWKSILTPEMARAAIVAGAEQLDNLTVGKRDALLYLAAGTLDCRIAGVRTALDNLCGTQNTLKGALIAAQKRQATRVEAILATGTGSDAAPGTTTFEGSISYQDVGIVRAS
jgi:hypothetical protein